MNPQQRASHAHVPALDGIRGLAILIVLLGHAWVNPAPGNGFWNLVEQLLGSSWIGVDLFFVLSGFLITGILYNSVHAENYFSVFYFRRFLRISPLYYGTLILLLILTKPLHIVWDGRQWILLGYLQNTGIGHHIFGRPYSPYVDLRQFWSLAVEEQFYLAWPLLVFLLKDFRKLVPTTLVLTLCALLLRVVLVAKNVNPLYIYMLTATRADSLMLGALLALLLRGPEQVPQFTMRSVRLIFPVVFAMMVALAWPTRSLNHGVSKTTETVGFTLLGILFACLIALTLDSPRLQAMMSNPALRWLGAYSYGIYIFHPIVFRGTTHLLQYLFYGETAPQPWALALFSVAAVVATMVLAYLSFHLYEKHFLRLKDRMLYRFPAKARPEEAVLVPATGISTSA